MTFSILSRPFAAIDGLEVLVLVRIVIDLTIYDLVRITAYSFKVNLELMLEQDLIHVEEGSGSVHHDGIFVACALNCNHRTFSYEKDIVAVRVRRLDNLTVLIDHVAQ